MEFVYRLETLERGHETVYCLFNNYERHTNAQRTIDLLDSARCSNAVGTPLMRSVV